jgi:phage tail-like protein
MGALNMDGSTVTGLRLDPFPTFKFHVEIGNLTEAAFMECSGLEMATEIFEYKEGGVIEFVHKVPGRSKSANVTLKRGFAVSKDIYLWYKEMEDSLRQGKPFNFRQVSITLYTTVEQGKVMRWALDKAFPVKWVGPSLKTDEAAFAVETLEFAHHGIQVLGR